MRVSLLITRYITDVISLVKKHAQKRPYRPAYSVKPDMTHKESVVVELSIQCWSENPTDRPTFKHLLRHSLPKITSLRLVCLFVFLFVCRFCLSV